MLKIKIDKKILNKNNILKCCLNFNKDEITALIGQSGCGKTSILKIIGGLDYDYEGELKKDEINYSENFPLSKIHTMMQDFYLIDNLTVRENIKLGFRDDSDETKKSKLKRFNFLIEQIDIKDIIDSKVEFLSYGQKQRVAFVRTVIGLPDFAILDEPFSSVSNEIKYKMIECLLNLKRKYKMGIIFTTHDFDDCIVLANKVLFMNKYKIICNQNTNDIYEKPVNKELAFILKHYNVFVFKNEVLTTYFKNMFLNTQKHNKQCTKNSFIEANILSITEMPKYYVVLCKQICSNYILKLEVCKSEKKNLNLNTKIEIIFQKSKCHVFSK